MLDEYRRLLPGYIANKSVSTDPSFHDGIIATVAWLKDILEKGGFTVTVVEGYDNPIIVASYVVDPKLQTCLIYGHYDVQPADKNDGWDSDPFVATERDGRFYCRGAMDNKGQNLVHIVNILQLIKEQKLGYNVKFMLEGNEETGSAKIPNFMADHRDLLAADFVLISDGILAGESPAIEVGFRGTFSMTLAVRTAGNAQHSGSYGGAMPNAAQELSKLLAGMYDDQHRITVPGFADGVDEIGPEEKANLAKIPFSEDEYRRVSGAKATVLAPGVDFHTATGLLPTMQITGLLSGYTGNGYRNAIPPTAVARINVRTVLHQDGAKVVESFRAYVQANLPAYADFELEAEQPASAVKVNVDNPFVQRTAKKLANVYGSEPLYVYVGGTVPIVTLFQDMLKIPPVMAPLTNEDSNMHGANENFGISYIEKGLAFSRAFFEAEK